MKRTVRVVVLIAFFGALLGMLIYNSLNPPKPDMTPWNEAMTMGNRETAKYHYIMYTDISCPYCSKFSDAIAAHEEEFKRDYIEGHNIYFEVRLTDINALNGHSQNSRSAGEAVYCAARQNQFWEYYHALLGALYTDYHSKGIGTDKNAKPIDALKTSYYLDVAGEIAGLDQEKFTTCVENHETGEEIDKNTQQMAGKYGGVPFFIFNNKPINGFAGTFNADTDWKQAKLMLDAGLNS